MRQFSAMPTHFVLKGTGGTVLSVMGVLRWHVTRRQIFRCRAYYFAEFLWGVVWYYGTRRLN